MVQWVASPLNQDYLPMTKKSGDMGKGKGKIPWIAEETGQHESGRITVKIYPLKNMRSSPEHRTPKSSSCQTFTSSGKAMVQRVASPLNQSYFSMTKKSGERGMREGKTP